jgi:hypothetical protein
MLFLAIFRNIIHALLTEVNQDGSLKSKKCHVLQRSLGESFAKLPFLLNSGHCEEQSDVAILWIINMF